MQCLDLVASRPISLDKFLGIDWFEVIEIERKNVISSIGWANGIIEPGDEIKADFHMIIGEFILGKSLIKM